MKDDSQIEVSRRKRDLMINLFNSKRNKTV